MILSYWDYVHNDFRMFSVVILLFYKHIMCVGTGINYNEWNRVIYLCEPWTMALLCTYVGEKLQEFANYMNKIWMYLYVCRKLLLSFTVVTRFSKLNLRRFALLWLLQLLIRHAQARTQKGNDALLLNGPWRDMIVCDRPPKLN